MRFATKRIIPLFIVLSLFLFAGCGKEEQVVVQGDVTVEAPPIEQQQEENVEATMPKYDYRTLPKSDALKFEEYKSYYREELSERNRIVYDEILEAATKHQTEVVLSKQPSQKDFQKIMNIIFIDTPEAYPLATEYEYDTDTNGNVFKVYLKFVIKEDSFDRAEDMMLQRTTDAVSSIRTSETELEAEQKLVELLRSLYYSPHLYIDGQDSSEIFVDGCDIAGNFAAYTKTTGNAFFFAKAFAYFSRQAGLESAVVVGEITNQSLLNRIGIEQNDYDDLTSVIKISVDGTHVSVVCDYSSLYAWNIVKLNGNWYHVDTLLSTYYAEEFSERGDVDFDEFYPLLNVPDITISQSRLFHVNEDILGATPECNNTTFQYYYRSGDYFLDYNESQNVVATTKLLKEMVSTTKAITIVQFETEEAYDIFCRDVDRLIKTYNNNNGNPIRGYKIDKSREFLTIIIYNVYYTEQNEG